MERVPATVVSVVVAPEAAHAERPAHLHHGILGGSSGSRTEEDLQSRIQSKGRKVAGIGSDVGSGLGGGGSTQRLESEKRDRRRRLARVVAHAEGGKGIQSGSERAEVIVEHR